MRNPGEIPQCYMIGSYEAIIDKETFRKGLEKLAENKKKEPPLFLKYIQNRHRICGNDNIFCTLFWYNGFVRKNVYGKNTKRRVSL